MNHVARHVLYRAVFDPPSGEITTGDRDRLNEVATERFATYWTRTDY